MDPSATDIEAATRPVWEQAKDAIAEGDGERASALIDAAVVRWRSLQDYSVNWITSLLSFIADELGEESVERALRRFGEEFLHDRRATDPPWSSLPAEVRAAAVVKAMVANFGSCEVEEEPDRFVLRFACGTGGRLIDEGKYRTDGDMEAGQRSSRDGYAVLRERAGRTFSRASLPVYCAHCAVNNEMQAIEWDGVPTTVEHPPERPGDPCVHHIYRDADSIPDEVFVRLGTTPPGG
jgi:hypothetical protein